MIYDVAIIGCGIAGTFAALKLSEKKTDLNCIVLELGKPPQKRRRQIEGFLGCFPTGNGLISLGDLDTIHSDGRKLHHAKNWVYSYFSQVNPMHLIKNSGPNIKFQKLLEKDEFSISKNDYYQWKPEHVHKLSRVITEKLDNLNNITFKFESIVENIEKHKNKFIIYTDSCIIECHKLIVAVGRSGWRWVTDIYKNLGLKVNDNIAKYGIRLEVPAQYMKELNKSVCTLNKGSLEVGPFLWNGTIIPEDHSDLVISAFRSNETRWKSEKVSFSILNEVNVEKDGVKYTDRVGKLTLLLFNDRIGREKVKLFLNNSSLLSLLPEYAWLHSAMDNLEQHFPQIKQFGYMHLPNVSPLAAKINLSTDLETDIGGLYVIGESARIHGILGAAVSGALVASSIMK